MQGEIFQKLMNADSEEEIKAIATENRITLSDEVIDRLLSIKAGDSSLSDEELNSVAGGCGDDDEACPRCGSTDWICTNPNHGLIYTCKQCDFKWSSPTLLID